MWSYSPLVVAVELFVGGVLSEAVALVFPRLWGFSSPLEPSPVERRLQSRFLSSLTPLAIVVGGRINGRGLDRGQESCQ